MTRSRVFNNAPSLIRPNESCYNYFKLFHTKLIIRTPPPTMNERTYMQLLLSSTELVLLGNTVRLYAVVVVGARVYHFQMIEVIGAFWVGFICRKVRTQVTRELSRLLSYRSNDRHCCGCHLVNMCKLVSVGEKQWPEFPSLTVPHHLLYRIRPMSSSIIINAHAILRSTIF